ncbi:MAG: hypothetical protein ACTSYQ_00385 [Candidatus Odinarchaeia archaeon]
MNKLREGALKYIDCFLKSLALVLGIEEMPNFRSELEKLDYAEKVLTKAIESHKKLKEIFYLMNELTALRSMAAKNVKNHLTLIRGILEGEINGSHLPIFLQHAFSDLDYVMEIEKEGLRISELPLPIRRGFLLQ